MLFASTSRIKYSPHPVLLIAQVYVLGGIPPTALLLPVVLAPLVLTTVGLTWIFSAFGVYLRDIGQTTVVITTVALFLSPVFYPVTALPEEYRFLFLLNPLTFIIEQARDFHELLRGAVYVHHRAGA